MIDKEILQDIREEFYKDCKERGDSPIFYGIDDDNGSFCVMYHLDILPNDEKGKLFLKIYENKVFVNVVIAQKLEKENSDLTEELVDDNEKCNFIFYDGRTYEHQFSNLVQLLGIIQDIEMEIEDWELGKENKYSYSFVPVFSDFLMTYIDEKELWNE